MVREILLTQGKIALVDDADYAAVRAIDWIAHVLSHTTYAVATIPGGKAKFTGLHNFLMSPPPGLLVDHINRNGLDCRRSNMRLADTYQNAFNRVVRTGASGYRGVVVKQNGAAFASLRAYGVVHRRGPFPNAAEAAKAYDELCREHHGEFGVLNFPAEAA